MKNHETRPNSKETSSEITVENPMNSANEIALVYWVDPAPRGQIDSTGKDCSFEAKDL
jgi:hypothetical protein